MKQLLTTEDWGHSIYNAYLDLNGNYKDLIPSATGVQCVCIDENKNIVLNNNEPLGGHIDKNEKIEDALKRQSLEKGGISLTTWKYFGYYEITLKDTAPPEFVYKYPKVGYILFFLAEGKKISEPYGKDALSVQFVTKDHVLVDEHITHKMLIEGVKLYPDYLLTGK